MPAGHGLHHQGRNPIATGGRSGRDVRGRTIFFEPPGAVHLVSANASMTEPAELIAVFVADEGAQLTMLKVNRGNCRVGKAKRAHHFHIRCVEMMGTFLRPPTQTEF